MGTTGVSKETALKWERSSYVNALRYAPDSVATFVRDHFVEARTKKWGTRLEEYRFWQTDKKTSEKTHGKYRLHRAWASAYTRNPSMPSRIMSGRLEVVDAYGFFFCDPDRLEHEVWKVNGMIEICRQDRVGTEFHGFMDLPSEIRNMIYEYALVKGKVCVPNFRIIYHLQNERGQSYQRYQGLPESLRDRPLDVQLLNLIRGVSRLIHEEATRMFFGRNQLIFPAGPFSRPRHFNGPSGYDTDSVFEYRDNQSHSNYASLCRDVSYTFDMRDYGISNMEAFSIGRDIRSSVSAGAISSLEAMQALHDFNNSLLERLWIGRIDAIKQMALDRLQLDFEECYCVSGCHRRVSWVLDHLQPSGGSRQWRDRPPHVIEVMGYCNAEEKEMIREKLEKQREYLASIEIRFIDSIQKD